jgi:uncharacterized membrane protein (UPF0136 family)
MTSVSPQSAQDDLAFLRALLKSGDGLQKPLGEGYFTAGLLYGGQMLASAAQLLGWLPQTSAWGLAIGLGPTAIFAVALTAILMRSRSVAPTGLMARAIAAVFGAVGLANLALVAVIGAVAWREHSLTTWLIYPCTVFVLQGLAWFVAFQLRLKAWLALVAAGWIVCAIAMAWWIESMPHFIAIAGFGLVACMLTPGAVMMRLARRAA